MASEVKDTEQGGISPQNNIEKHEALSDEDLDDDDDDDAEFDEPTEPGNRRSNLFTRLHEHHWSTRLKRLIFPGKTSSEDFENFVPNYRYIPILSGIVIPFSILLEIPALTDRWYIRTDGHTIVETRPNPVILDVGLGFSMFCAVLANLCLVGRFLEWRVGLMTLLCVVFLSIHDIINIIAITVFGVEHRFSDGFTYGQAFWMTVCSTTCSTFTNITLLVDLVRTKNFEVSGSGLTRKQRSLSIIIIILLCYIALGSLIHSFLLHLSFIDALYFTVITIETIGFGDISPESAGARVFVSFYSVFGIVNLALAIGLIRETVLEGLEVGYYKRVQDVRRQRRMTAWKKRVVQRWHRAVQWRLQDMGKPIWIYDPEANDSRIVHTFRKGWVWTKTRLEDILSFVGLDILTRGIHKGDDPDGTKGSLANYRHPRIRIPRGMKLNLEALSQRQLEAAAYESGVPLAMLLPPDFWERKEKGPDIGLKPRRTLKRSATSAGLLSSPAPSSNRPHLFHPTALRTSQVDHFVHSPANGGGQTTPRSPPPTKDGGLPTITPHDVYRLAPSGEEPEEDHDVPLTQARLGRMIALMGKFALAVDSSTHLKGNVPKANHSKMRSGGGGEKKKKTSTYDLFKESIEEEEKRAFYSRLTASWFLFLLFWLVGGVIFQATEDWTYGEALYFCVIAFTTIGYGDFSPRTPAGRSIFVAWALLGVGTMTVLISIVAGAYSDRYQNAMHSNVFDRAVKQYQSRAGDSNPFASSKRHRRPPPPTSLPPGTTCEHTSSALDQAEKKAKDKLELLPYEMLRNIRAFYQHVQFFVGPNAKANAGNLSEVPEGLRKLMDDISGEERLSERIKMEILQDENARQTLFTLGIEKEFRKLIESAEDAIDVITERNHLSVAHELSKEQESMQRRAGSSSKTKIEDIEEEARDR